MTMLTPASALEIGPAAPADVAEIAQVLQEAARWIETWRDQLWVPELLGEDFVAPVVARGEFLAARIEGEIAGVAIVQPEDTLFWPDRPPGEAGYLHKLAVRRAHAGKGVSRALIEAAAMRAAGWGRSLLRLDCHPDLARLYVGFGFRKVDERAVVHPESGPLTVARMERGLRP
jgi:GNAT superfamily N-acetyltransferase